GPTPALGLAVEDRSLVTGHRVQVWDLAPCTRYVFAVSSSDLAGNVARDDRQGQLHGFVTERGQGLAFADDFELDRGWTRTGEWERDRPRGLRFATAASMDPNAAVSRSRVLGIDLTGLGLDPGNYEANVASETAVSPAIDA